MQLRKYQIDIINALRKSFKIENKRVILGAPTGAGKTIMFSFMVSEHLKREGKILIFTHRKELLKQTGGAFTHFGLKPTFIRAGEYPEIESNCHVAMIETFNRRIENYKEFLNTRTMIIIDEAHLESFTKIFEYINPTTFVIGATATPFRKGNQTSLDKFYTDLVYIIDTPELIKLGYLSEAEYFGVEINTKGMKKIGDELDTSKYYEETKMYCGVVENYSRLVKGKKTIVFTSNVKSSIMLADEFKLCGFNAQHIDANTKNREDIFKWFNDNSDAILCNCGIATTGFDQPDIECVILYMATTSLVKYLQCCGRGSRVTETKKHFKILDFGNNVKRLGFWCDNREWSLKKKVKKDGIKPIKYCPNCGAIISKNASVCPYCEYNFEKVKKQKEQEFAELKKLTKKQIFTKAVNGDIYTKAELARNKEISPFWVLHQLTDITEARLFIKLMGWKSGFEYLNRDRFKVFQK